MSEYDAPKGSYYLRLPRWPKFEFTNNDIDGRVPVCHIESWKAFEQLVTEEHVSLGAGARIYRGHRRFDWQLAATLTREFNGGAISESLAAKLLTRFRLSMRGRGVDLTGSDDNEVWAFGQHFGLSTLLLDWTESPFVALFFAFAQDDILAEKENTSRAIFSLNRGLVEELLPNLFFEPVLGENARLVNQAGLFTVTSPGNDNLVSTIMDAVIDSGSVEPDNADEIARYIFKVHISNHDRLGCLSMLRRMNIHHANLFPDPTGASSYCNDWLRREIIEEQHINEAHAELASKPTPIPQREEVAQTAPVGEPANIQTILASLLVERDGITSPMVSGWASKIAKVYEEKAGLDWPLHPSSVSAIKVEIKRLLSALGFPNDRRDNAVEKLAAYFEKQYRAKYGLMFTHPKGEFYDKYFRART